jgi:hypothetical protein
MRSACRGRDRPSGFVPHRPGGATVTLNRFRRVNRLLVNGFLGKFVSGAGRGSAEETVSRHAYGFIWLGYFAIALMLSGQARAIQLITPEEANLPPPKGAIPIDRRGILRGPKVEVVSPNNSAQSSPLHLHLRFESFGGAKINPDSVRVIYLRTPNVDLTPRVKPFIQPDGIDIPDTELPPGEYTVRVEIKDSDGRPGTASFTLKVSPP